MTTTFDLAPSPEYLLALAEALEKAQILADGPPDGNGWGGGYRLPKYLSPLWGNLSDLLFEIGVEITEAAANAE